ncbi:hypothetical protein N656DRAFT_784454 [Canariomyces notabilis]|uniref:Uncharacterized protein n=1 Tax=Canariomyces notabilis TaxID=2074819 RepID=A0AAN6QJ03_9PEZI|nr:hypothetical protein N656DRAFT_784454 [Canariomyces arenarius]
MDMRLVYIHIYDRRGVPDSQLDCADMTTAEDTSNRGLVRGRLNAMASLVIQAAHWSL